MDVPILFLWFYIVSLSLSIYIFVNKSILSWYDGRSVWFTIAYYINIWSFCCGQNHLKIRDLKK